VAVQDPQQQPQQTHPQVQRLIDAAQVGAVVKAAGAATAAPGVAVTLPAVAATKIVTTGAEAIAHGVKIALVLRILRALFRRRHAAVLDKQTGLEAMLRKRFPNLDPAVIRQAVQREIAYEDAFQRKGLRRVEADAQKANQLPTEQARAKRMQEIIAREKHYGVLRERAMFARAIAHCDNETVRQASPDGAKWVLGAAKNHTLGCLALAGKNWPWEVLDTIPPPLHTGCQCSLRPLGRTDTVPPVGEAMAMARRAIALEEAVREVADPGEVDAFLAGEAIRPSVARAICELQEVGYEERLHPRGRGGKWMRKLGAKRIELKGEKKLTTPQVHAAVRKVAQGLADFYGGEKSAVTAHHEPDYMASVAGVARFRHPQELMAGINYGQKIMDTVRDPEYGVHDLRIVAHEAAHSLSGTRPGPLPGFSQTVEEGGAEVLSLWFWHHRAQPLDERDAVRLSGKWSKPGADTLAHSVVYRPYVEELMRRTASKVGWDRTAMIDEIERVMRGDHHDRINFRDETDPDFPLPKDLPEMERNIGNEDETDHAVPLIRWLISDDKPEAPAGTFDTGELKTEQAKTAATTAEHAIKEATGSVVPMRLTQLPDHDTATARSLPPGGVIALHEDSSPTTQTSAIVHEYAHGIDRARDNDDWFTQTGEFKPLYDVLMASPTVKSLKADEVELMKGDDRGRAQLLQGRELFARAFEQYVAEHGDNEMLRERMAKLTADPLLGFQHWQADEFKPIAAELEKALPKIYAELAAKPELREAHWSELLHPRGRRGQWVDAIVHAEPEPAAPSRHEGFTGEDFAQALNGFTHSGITAVRANRTETQHLYGEVWLNLQKPGESAPVGLARVTLKPPNNRGERVAEYSNIYLKEDEQNQGFGRAFTDHVLKTLRDGGVDRIELEAVSIGGYAWARRGFVWTGDKAAVQREILQAAKDDGRWERLHGHLPQSRYDELERKLLAGEFASEAELAAYGIEGYWWNEEQRPRGMHEPKRQQDEDYEAPVRERTWLGKELMIGSRWKGSRPVTIEAQDVR
jgi:GNAT superfamily N-acetyltransferase